MKFLKKIFVILAVILLGGWVFSFVENGSFDNLKDNIFIGNNNETPDNGNPDSGNNDNEAPDNGDGAIEDDYVFLGTEGTVADFSASRLVNSGDCSYLLYDSDRSVGEVYYDDSCSEITFADGKLNFVCTQSYSNITPNLRFEPLKNFGGSIRSSDFSVLTVDFDIEYDVDFDSLSNSPSRFRAFFNFSDSIGTINSGESFSLFFEEIGHYTFVFLNTGDPVTMKLLVYLDGQFYVGFDGLLGVNNYDPKKFYLSWFNIYLPLAEGDTVSVDNVAFYYFDNDYDGELKNLLNNPRVNLSTVRDAKGYQDSLELVVS